MLARTRRAKTLRPNQRRLDKLEASVARLTDALRAVEARVSALEGAARADRAVPSAGSAAAEVALVGGAPESLTLPGFLSFLGRSLLVLGGAFLVRALTDSGTLPRPAGVALGLAYALAWVVSADRAAVRGLRLSAGFHGLTAMLIAYPLIWEAATRFGALPAPSAATAVAGVTGLFLALAWRRDLPALAWAATLAALATALALLVATYAIQSLAAVALGLGLATVWLGYDRGWLGPRWPAAVAADLVVLAMTDLVAREGGPPEAYRDLSRPVALAIALALPILYLASFALRTLVRRREVAAFEALQAGAALLVGLGGAVGVARSAGTGEGTLGAAALALGAGCYAVSFVFVGRPSGQARNLAFYSSLALALTLWGSSIVGGHDLLAPLACVLAVVAAGLAARFERVTLRAHSAVYVAAAAGASGLAPATWDALVAPASRPWHPLTPSALPAFAAALACYTIMVVTRKPEGEPWQARLPAAAAGLISVCGLGALGVLSLVSLTATGGAVPDPGGVAVARTAVVALAALAIAAGRSLAAFGPLAWLPYPLLLCGGLKLLVEDLRYGRPATLFPAFVLYGIALIVAPRLSKASDPAGSLEDAHREQDQPPHQPKRPLDRDPHEPEGQE